MVNGNLPPGWVWTTIGELFDVVGGGTPSTNVEKYWTGDIPWITSADIHGLEDIRPRKCITEEAIISSATNLVPSGTIIVVTRVSLGKVALTSFPICFSQDSQALLPKNGLVFSKYSLYYLSLISESFKYKSRGTTISGIPKKQLRDLPIPLPPLPDQERIVERIESLFTQLDAGVAGLKRIKEALKRYKASVLKAACEGRLVPQDPNDEPAEEMLKRLGKVPLDSYDLPELPKGWCWATLKNVTEPIQKINPKENPDKEFIYIDISSIDNNIQQIISPKYYIGADAPSRARQLVNANDVLFSTVRTYLKNISIVPEIYDKQVASTGFCVLRATSVTSGKYIFYFSQTDSFLNPLTELQRGTSYPAVRDSDVWEQSIPIPPFSEQERIVSVVEQHFSVIQELEQTIDANLKRAGRLRQSILKRAFEGKLVTPRVRATHTQTDETLESQPPAPDQPISSNTGSPQPAKSRK